MTGASLTGVTVMVETAGALVALAESVAVKVSVRSPAVGSSEVFS